MKNRIKYSDNGFELERIWSLQVKHKLLTIQYYVCKILKAGL
ncbi:hypothetical protein [Clostridium estertheticum]|nr:hypothetical protein [Clostridium estertheticum]